MLDSLLLVFHAYWAKSEILTNVVVFLNIFGALLLGLIVGYERSYRGRAAGMRTYGMVCMASCALTVITGYPEYWYGGQAPALVNAIDPGRVIQGVCTGIGFLGAGVIMRDGLNISGLTTAASIWAVSAIGVLVGVGFYGSAIALAFLSAVFMMWGGKIDSILPSRHAIAVTIRFHDNATPSEEEICRIMKGYGYEVARGSFSVMEHSRKPEWRFVSISIGKNQGISLVDLGRALSETTLIETYTLSHARN